MNKVIKSIPDGLEASYADELTTDLSEGTRTSDSIEIQSSTGQNYFVPAATDTLAGLMSGSDKSKIDNNIAEAEHKLELIAGVVRQDSKGSGWYIISTSGHISSGITGVSVASDGTLQINHTPNATSVGTLIAVQDETYASYGITMGASVGENISYFTGFMDMRFTINTDTMSNSVDPFFEDYVTLSKDSTTGIISVTHPNSYSKNIVQIESLNLDTHGDGITWMVQNKTSTSFDLVPYSIPAEYYTWDGTTFTEHSDNIVDKPTFTVNTDGLVKMVFPVGNSTSTEFGIYEAIGVWSTSFPNNISVTYQDNKNLQFYFIDASGATVPKANFNAYTKFYFSSRVKMRTKKTYGYLNILCNDVQLDFNSVYGAGANFWIYGAMVL